ncbi:MAG: VCBS repeat-containing protein [Myxococcales bacterium]|nr:VCBS repeat-containing protein [Myxococcales bacterium]
MRTRFGPLLSLPLLASALACSEDAANAALSDVFDTSGQPIDATDGADISVDDDVFETDDTPQSGEDTTVAEDVIAPDDTSGAEDTDPIDDVTPDQDTGPTLDVTPDEDTGPVEDVTPDQDTGPTLDVTPDEDTGSIEDVTPAEDTAGVDAGPTAVCGDDIPVADMLCFLAPDHHDAEGQVNALVVADWAQTGNVLYAVNATIIETHLKESNGFADYSTVDSGIMGPIVDMDYGDFDNDGDVDIISGRSSSSAGVLRGTGDGAVQAAFATGSGEGNVVDVTVADIFGSEGGDDFATGNENGCGSIVQVQDLSGEGTVASTLQICAPSRVELMRGSPTVTSLARASGAMLTVVDVLPAGVGNVATGDTTATIEFAATIVRMQAADLDADGLEDLVVLTANDQVHVLVSDGGGDFVPDGASDYATYATGAGAADIAIADLEGDGEHDIVVVNTTDETLTVLNNAGSAYFVSELLDLPDGTAPTRVAAGDLNGDDIADIAVASPGKNGISILLSDP